VGAGEERRGEEERGRRSGEAAASSSFLHTISFT